MDYTNDKSKIMFTVINGFICDYEFIPRECELPCRMCSHAKDYRNGGHPGDRKFRDVFKLEVIIT